MAKKIALKPCPLCGSDIVRLLARDIDGERCINFDDEVERCDAIYIHCYECGYDMSVPEDALYLVDVWNSRRGEKKDMEEENG